MKKVIILSLICFQALSFSVPPKLKAPYVLVASWLRKVEDRLEYVEEINEKADSYQTILEASSHDEMFNIAAINVLIGSVAPASWVGSMLFFNKISESYYFVEKCMHATLGTFLLGVTGALIIILKRANTQAIENISANKRIIKKLEDFKQAHMHTALMDQG